MYMDGSIFSTLSHVLLNVRISDAERHMAHATFVPRNSHYCLLKLAPLQEMSSKAKNRLSSDICHFHVQQ